MSTKRSIQGKSNHVAILRQPCRYVLKGTCTRSPCEFWHPPECHFYKTETGCKARDKCMFPHHKVDEQPNKKPKKGYYSNKRRESDDKNAVAFVKIVSQLGCVSQDSDALVSQRGKQPRGNPMQSLGTDSKNTIHTVYPTSSRSPRKQRTIAWKNTSQNSSSAKFPRCKNLRTDPKKRLKDKSDAPAARREESCQKIFTSSKKKEQLHSFRLPMSGLCRPPEERDFVVDSGASVHMVSKKDLNSSELETTRTSRSPTTVMMTANGEVQTREEATVCVKQLDLFVTVMLPEETSAVLSLGKLCETIGIHTTGPAAKNHISPQNGKRIDCNISKLCAIRSPWFIDEFLYYAFIYLCIIFITGFSI